jgi:hypothetical protein
MISESSTTRKIVVELFMLMYTENIGDCGKLCGSCGKLGLKGWSVGD